MSKLKVPFLSLKKTHKVEDLLVALKSKEIVANTDIIDVLLTGMGSDGAKELLRLKEKGAYTIAQDEKTSVVYGMANVAEKLGAVTQSLPLKDISKAMIKSLKKYRLA